MAFIDGEILTAKALNDAFTDVTNAANRDNIIVIGGVEYQASGSMAVSLTSKGGSVVGGTYIKNYGVTMPFTPPTGWAFQVTGAGESGGATWSSQATTGDSNKVWVNVFSANGGGTLTRLHWHLIKIS